MRCRQADITGGNEKKADIFLHASHQENVIHSIVVGMGSKGGMWVNTFMDCL